MKVAVIGPGAMGCLFAARIQQSGTEAILVDHRPERAERLDRDGIVVEVGDTRFEANPSVTTHMPTGLDFIVVLTKAYSTHTLRFPPDTPVLTLQNGLGNVEELCSIAGSARVLAGTSSEGATLLGEGRVRHAANGTTRVGSWTSCPVEPVAEVLEKAGFSTEITESPGQMIWEKAAVSAGINPLSALIGVPNGRLVEMREVRQLMRDLVVEATKVASTEGYRFERSLVEMAEEICANTADNISSMLQDVRANRQTEIDAISGEILRRASLASLPAPRTRVVHQLVRGLESR